MTLENSFIFNQERNDLFLNSNASIYETLKSSYKINMNIFYQN